MNDSTYNIALFQISLKSLIIKDHKILTLISKNGHYDFPGGRIDNNEIKEEFGVTLKRELAEELSANFKFKIGPFAFASKRVYRKDKSDFNVLALFFNITALNNEISLSDEHQSLEWLTISELLSNPDKFVSIDEFNHLKDYLIISKITYNN